MAPVYLNLKSSSFRFSEAVRVPGPVTPVYLKLPVVHVSLKPTTSKCSEAILSTCSAIYRMFKGT